MTTYTNQTPNISTYINSTREVSVFSNAQKSSLIAGIAYNSSYAYNDADVTYEGAVSFAGYTNQTKN